MTEQQFFFWFLLSERILCKENLYYHEKIPLRAFDIFVCFEVFWVHLCYFHDDISMYVCMWVNTKSSKWCIQWSPNLLCILYVIVEQTVLNVANVKFIICCCCYYRSSKRILKHYVQRSQLTNTFYCLNGAFNWVQILLVHYRSPSNDLCWFWWV